MTLLTTLWVAYNAEATRTPPPSSGAPPLTSGLSWETSGEYYLPSAADLEAEWLAKESEKSTSTQMTSVEASDSFASHQSKSKRIIPEKGTRKVRQDHFLSLASKLRGREKSDLDEQELEELKQVRKYFNNRLHRQRKPGAPIDAIKQECQEILYQLPGRETHNQWKKFIGPLRPEDERRRSKTENRRRLDKNQKTRAYMKKTFNIEVPAPRRGRPSKSDALLSEQGKGKGIVEESSHSEEWNGIDSLRDYMPTMLQEHDHFKSQHEMPQMSHFNLAEILPKTWKEGQSRHRYNG